MKEKIKTRMVSAMKSKDTETLKVMRSIITKITEQEKINNTELSDDDIIKVIEKLSKQREESILNFEKGNRPDLVASEKQELAILKEYLPTKMSEEAIRLVVENLIREDVKDIGTFMKSLNIYGNLIDKKIASSIFKELNV